MNFSHQNTKLYAAISALRPESGNFLDLVDCTSVEAEFVVAKTYVAKFNDDEKTKPKTNQTPFKTL